MPGVVDNTLGVTEASSTRSEIESAIIDTDISISNPSGSPGSDLLSFTLANDGSEKLWNFENFDVIMTFDGATSGRLIENINYAETCPPTSGNWCITSFSGDLLDPEILNEGESMDIEVRVSENLAAGIIIVLVSTDNGVVTSLAGMAV